jgi:hypothetical protein
MHRAAISGCFGSLWLSVRNLLLLPLPLLYWYQIVLVPVLLVLAQRNTTAPVSVPIELVRCSLYPLVQVLLQLLPVLRY